MKVHHLFLSIVCCLLSGLVPDFINADPVTEEKTWTETFPVTGDNPQLTIDNIWGSIRVRSGEANKITVTINERRSAPTPADFERSKKLIPLTINANANAVSMLVGDRDLWRQRQRNRCRQCRVDYDFEVTVPAGTDLDVSTVLDGSVTVDEVRGEISAGNVNGPVTVTNLHQCRHIKSINKDVDLVFAQSPNTDCHIENLNGNTSVSLPAGVSIDVTFMFKHGEIQSEFDLYPLQSTPEIENFQRDGRHVYRIAQKPAARIGGGGATLHFFSMNGHLHLSKQ